MAKNRHSWSKGYNRRQADSKRVSMRLARYGLKEDRRAQQKDLAAAYREASLVTWRQKAQQYRSQRENLKELNRMAWEEMQRLYSRLDAMTTRLPRIFLLGAIGGATLGWVVARLLL